MNKKVKINNKVSEVKEANETIETIETNETVDETLISVEDISSGKIIVEEAIKVRTYLSFIEKQDLIKGVCNVSLVEDEYGMFSVNYLLKDMITKFLICKHYTNIDLDISDIIEAYDILEEKGVISFVLERIGTDYSCECSDYYILINCIDNELKQSVELSYKIEKVLSKFLGDIQKDFSSTKVEKWIKSIGKSLKDFSPENYAKLQELLAFSKDGEASKEASIKPIKPIVKK